MKKMEQRKKEVITKDQEELVMEDIEAGLEADVAYLWKRTREMAGHESWTEYECGCDCNYWNRIELGNAIRRLRAFRAGTYQAY